LETSSVIAIGSSTGGTEALRALFSQMPEKIPPIMVVQHIPPVFSAAFAKRLNEICPFEVREARDGDQVHANLVLIAPGGKQMRLKKSGASLNVEIFESSPAELHKPCVDILFDSVAELLGKHAIGVILTGMGVDGAKGLLKMRQAGARTVAQDEATSVVFGMPREAIQVGAAQEVRPLLEISDLLIRWLAKKAA
jgi:two-component system chemotaxis response regulator CheB